MRALMACRRWVVGAAAVSSTLGGVRAASSAPPRKTVSRRDDLDIGAPLITIGPEAPESLVFFLHGLGDTARGWEAVADMLAPRFPSTRWILPTAPSQPVTVNNGFVMPSWYDIVGFERRDAETCAGIEGTRAAVTTLMEEQFAASDGKLTPATTVLAGFSQGGAVSLWTGLQRAGDAPLAGVMCLSGYLPQPTAFSPTEAGLQTPVLLMHGEADPVVPFTSAEATEHVLKDSGVAVEFQAFADLEHSANLEEIEEAAAFLTRVLPSP
mmetsp:Transcript_4450/g.11310  ORF Transcript_4450/g.11310 Transcript_4450/m.11310 type:complete len:268 (+) Transcript_4450:68-871(+)